MDSLQKAHSDLDTLIEKMRYQGGKSDIAKQIAAIINQHESQNYYEPFVGGASVLAEVKKQNRTASDISEDLIMMWKAVQDGWTPPGTITEDQYNSLKNAQPSALRGFAGYGSSWGAKWFDGYARDPKGNTNYAAQSRDSILKKKPNIMDVLFLNTDYKNLDIRPGSVVYCDPPYAGTEGYDKAGSFNHNEFWDWVRKTSGHSKVFVSELKAPEDFTVVWSRSHNSSYHNKNGAGKTRTEKLFTL